MVTEPTEMRQYNKSFFTISIIGDKKLLGDMRYRVLYHHFSDILLCFCFLGKISVSDVHLMYTSNRYDQKALKK